MDLEYIAQQEEPVETPPRNFATVAAVYADGVTLLFDGEAAPSAKHYKTNTSVYFQAGDRVRIFEDSGTYVVEYVVGPPAQAPTVGIPAGGTNGQALMKNSAESYDASWKTITGTLPTGGSDGQALRKVSGSPAWADVNEVPSGGTTDYVLTKTANGYAWAAIPVQTPDGIKDTGTTYTLYFRIYNNHLEYRRGSGGTWTTLVNA